MAAFITNVFCRAAFVLAACVVSYRAAAQAPPQWQWGQANTSASSVRPYKLITDAVGNVYVCGIFTDPITLAPSKVLTAVGRQDAYVAKYSPTGTLLWARQVGGTDIEEVAGLALDSAGNLCLAGSCGNDLQLGTLRLTTAYGAGGFLARLSPQGQPLWLKQVGSTGARPHNMGLDAADNFYLSGQLMGPDTFGSIRLDPGSGIDVFLAKFDAQGNAIWARQGGHVPLIVNGPAVLTAYHSLTVSSGGDCYLSCTLNPQSGNFGPLARPASYGGFDVVLVKYDAQGAPRWLKCYGTTLDDWAGNIALDAQGHALACMRFSGGYAGGAAVLDTQTLSGTGLYFGALLQLDAATGSINWARTLSADRDAAYRGVATDAAGNSYAAGSFAGSATLGSQQLYSMGSINPDAVVVSYSPQGTFRWAQQSGGYAPELADLVSLDGTGQLAVVGSFTGESHLGSITLTGPTAGNASSGWVARLAGLPTATRAGSPVQPLACYPNPATDALWLPALAPGTPVQLLDALGRVARQTTVSAAANASVLGLPPGLYTLRATDKQGRPCAARVVVE